MTTRYYENKQSNHGRQILIILYFMVLYLKIWIAIEQNDWIARKKYLKEAMT